MARILVALLFVPLLALGNRKSELLKALATSWDTSVLQVNASFDSGFPDIVEVLGAMGRGISVEAVYDGYHGSEFGNDGAVEVQRQRIDRLQSMGFQHIRVPVMWGLRFHNDEKTRTIERVVRYAIQRGMFVVLSAHDERWLMDHYDGSDAYDQPWYELWRDISEHFRNEGARLVFELLDAPSGALSGQGGITPRDSRAIELTRRVNQVAYDAVRSVSRERVVLVMPNDAGDHKMARHVYPDQGALPGNGRDRWVGVSVHTHDPWEFCTVHGRNGYFHDIWEMKQTVDQAHRETLDWAMHMPAHLGQYGIGRLDSFQHERNEDIVREYYTEITTLFAHNGIPTTVRDDQRHYAVLRGHDSVFGIAESVLQAH